MNSFETRKKRAKEKKKLISFSQTQITIIPGNELRTKVTLFSGILNPFKYSQKFHFHQENLYRNFLFYLMKLISDSESNKRCSL